MKKNMIINIITLSVTAFLLVITIMAWYVSNRQVSAHNISGQVADYESIIQEVNVYHATKVSDTVYTKGELVSTGDKMIYDQFPEVYEPGSHGDLEYSTPPRLVEIKLKQGKALNKLDILTSTRVFPGTDNTENPGYITGEVDEQTGEVIDVTIALSPFLKFNKATLSGNTINVTSFSKYEYDEDGDISGTSINLINTSMTQVVYLLFDFDDDKFDLLYSNNIGNGIVDNADQINHYTDFKLMVFGGDA